MQLDLFNIIHVLIIFQSWLFAAVLLNKRGLKKTSNRLLAVFLVALGLQMLLYLLEDQGYSNRLSLATLSIVFSYGPLMYLYAISLTRFQFRFTANKGLHFVPFLLFFFLGLTGYDLRSGLGWLLYVSIGIYLWLSFRAIHKFRRVLGESRTNNEQLQLSWLKLAFGTFTVVIFADLFSFLLDIITPAIWLDNTLDFIVLGLVLFFVNTMVFKALNQPGIFIGITEEEEQLLKKDPNTLNKALFEQTNQTLIQTLEQLMNEQRPYTNPQLTISDLAKKLDIPVRQLSNLINSYYGQNFSQFINAYRIKAACERLIHPQDPQETILEVLYDVGFNSKSSFNTLFKKETGLTPTAYKKRHQNQ